MCVWANACNYSSAYTTFVYKWVWCLHVSAVYMHAYIRTKYLIILPSIDKRFAS